MSSFGTFIPVIGLNNGYPGQVSRTGGGNPFIVAKLANVNNANNINFGDPVMILPDSAGGTLRQAADFFTNGGGLAITTNIANTSTTATPTTLAGLYPGMFVMGTGIPVGTFIVSISQSAGTITLSKAATATNSTAALTYATFGGIAVREVKTQLGYPVPPGTSQIGYYAPGQMCEALVAGSIMAKINVGTPVQSGSVYLRAIVNGSIPAGLLGDLEAAPDGVNNILLPNVTFKTGTLDANNVAELTLLVRVAA